MIKQRLAFAVFAIAMFAMFVVGEAKDATIFSGTAFLLFVIVSVIVAVKGGLKG
ncbi:MAG: hypothetical protein K1X67_02400 [Fimbriimonadaceae bacterium]|nr:hypothetical protein [Fimbriimonadaceae bacterium]